MDWVSRRLMRCGIQPSGRPPRLFSVEETSMDVYVDVEGDFAVLNQKGGEEFE